MASPDLLVLHHTASPRTWGHRDVHHEHVVVRGWRDVGYHDLIRLEPGTLRAEVVQGRSYDLDDAWEPWERGAHARGNNSTSWACALVGNFSEESVPTPMLRAAAVLFAERCLRWNLNPWLNVKGHRELPSSATECPGVRLNLDVFRQRVANLIG